MEICECSVSGYSGPHYSPARGRGGVVSGVLKKLSIFLKVGTNGEKKIDSFNIFVQCFRALLLTQTDPLFSFSSKQHSEQQRAQH